MASKDYVRRRKLGGQEMFVPLAHPPGDAQADLGEALVVIAGIEQKAHSGCNSHTMLWLRDWRMSRGVVRRAQDISEAALCDRNQR